MSCNTKRRRSISLRVKSGADSHKCEASSHGIVAGMKSSRRKDAVSKLTQELQYNRGPVSLMKAVAFSAAFIFVGLLVINFLPAPPAGHYNHAEHHAAGKAEKLLELLKNRDAVHLIEETADAKLHTVGVWEFPISITMQMELMIDRTHHEKPLKHSNRSEVLHCDKLDAIVVPGGGSQRAESVSSLPRWVRRRLDAAAALWYEIARKRNISVVDYEMSSANKMTRDETDSDSAEENMMPYIVPLSAGTTQRPNYINSDGWPVLESSSAARYLVYVHHIPPTYILRETASLDTIGNAYFMRQLITDPARLRRLLIITSGFHINRTKAIFDWVLQVAHPESQEQSSQYHLIYASVSDRSVMPEGVLAERKQKELDSLSFFNQSVVNSAVFKKVWRPFTGETETALPFLQQLQKFIFHKHVAYSTQGLLEPRSVLQSTESY